MARILRSKTYLPFNGGPEPLEKEIRKILGLNREDRFSNPFFDLIQKRVRFVFRTFFAFVIHVIVCGHCESSCRSARR